MQQVVKTFIREEGGATAIEYGLIAALVSIAAIAAFINIGEILATLFGYISGILQTAVSGIG